jgi:hypothetical protein
MQVFFSFFFLYSQIKHEPFQTKHRKSHFVIESRLKRKHTLSHLPFANYSLSQCLLGRELTKPPLDTTFDVELSSGRQCEMDHVFVSPLMALIILCHWNFVMIPYSPNLGSMLLHTTNDDQLSTLTTKVVMSIGDNY